MAIFTSTTWRGVNSRIRTPGDGLGDVVAVGPKTSFCLIDINHFNPALPGSPASGVYNSSIRHSKASRSGGMTYTVQDWTANRSTLAASRTATTGSRSSPTLRTTFRRLTRRTTRRALRSVSRISHPLDSVFNRRRLSARQSNPVNHVHLSFISGGPAHIHSRQQ